MGGSTNDNGVSIRCNTPTKKIISSTITGNQLGLFCPKISRTGVHICSATVTVIFFKIIWSTNDQSVPINFQTESKYRIGSKITSYQLGPALSIWFQTM